MMVWTGDTMQIHLSKPGGQQEGPYTLEQINQDLAANKYLDTDYWAWHEGLPEWVPLYSLPGITRSADSTLAAAAVPQPKEVAVPSQPGAASPNVAAATLSAGPAPADPQHAPPQARAAAVPSAPAGAKPKVEEAVAPAQRQTMPQGRSTAEDSAAPASPAAEPQEEPPTLGQQVSSGMSSAALEEIFLFTTGDGPSAWQSPVVAQRLKEIIGEDLSTLRLDVSRDVVARCAVDELLKPDGSISEAVWHAMAALRPGLVQQARDRLYRICVRTFRIEADTTVALVLFYNKQKL